MVSTMNDELEFLVPAFHLQQFCGMPELVWA